MRHIFTRARVFALVLCLAGAGLTTACGSGGSTTNSITNASPQSTTFNIGDAPLNGVLAFEVTINNIILTGTKGTVSVLTNPTKVEVRQAGIRLWQRAEILSSQLLNIASGIVAKNFVLLTGILALFGKWNRRRVWAGIAEGSI